MPKRINANPLELEEIFLDDLLKKRGELELKERKIESPLDKKIFTVFFVCAIFFLSFLLVSSFDLQVINFGKYKAMALANKFLNLKVKAERGVIYDRNMKQLVSNNVRFDLYWGRNSALKEMKENAEDDWKEIAQAINLPLAEIKKKITESGEESEVLIKENLSHEELVFFETKINQFPGFSIKKEIQRNYFPEESLSHLLGYLGKISDGEFEELKTRGYNLNDYIGKEGLEKEYEDFLVEKKGIIEIERDAKGNEISRKIKENPSSGKSLVLSLDLGLQQKIRQVLADILAEGYGYAAAAVVLDPSNGDVLASVSLPSFDNNLFARGIKPKELEKLNNHPRHPQMNRVVSGTYPVGSTIKPLMGIAALEEGIINEETTFFCPLDLCLENKYTQKLECFSDWKFHGFTSLKKALAESVNPFFYIIGGGYERPAGADSRLVKHFEGLGPQRIVAWLKKFGWGEKTGIDLPGETVGRLPLSGEEDNFKNNAGWHIGDTYNLSIGQGSLLITPIQVAAAYEAIVNDGKIFKPRLVKEILSPSGEKEEKSPQIIRTIAVKPATLEIIREGMREAVVSPEGSSAKLASLPVTVAAKTGTAQTGREKFFHNWITLFAPYENPRFLMVIIVEDVKGTRVVAQRAAYEILNWYFSPH